MNKIGHIFVGLILLLLLTSCTNPTAAPVQTQSPTSLQPAEQTAQYPAPGEVITNYSPYPYPAPTTLILNTPSPTSTTDPTMGNVLGKLFLNGNAVKNMTLELAEVIKDASGRDIIAGLDRAKSPTTVTDDQGRFAFINVKPGAYALILDLITNQELMKYPGKEDSVIIQVEAGKEVDLGDLKYDSLPIP